MARLTPVAPRVMDITLRQLGFQSQLGFQKMRQKGSHIFYRHPDDRTTTVPHHRGHDLAVPLVRAILTDIRISSDEFLRLQRP